MCDLSGCRDERRRARSLLPPTAIMRTASTWIFVCLLALGASGCATVFKGSKQDVLFRSEPSGVDVRQDGRQLGTTPGVIPIDRGRSSTTVSVSKAGYEPGRVIVRTKPDVGWWVWDVGSCVIPIALCIPLLVDAISGAWMTVDQDEYVITLDPAHAPAAVVVDPSSNAQQAVNAVDLASCGLPGPGRATVTFDRDGFVTRIVVDSTSTRLAPAQLNCVGARLGSVRVVAGEPVSVVRAW